MIVRCPPLAAAVLLAAAVAAAGCATASSASGARPSPFPGAPSPFPGAPSPESTAETASRETESAPAPLAPRRVTALLDTALSLRGRPYVFGGDDPSTGFDCSGLIWYVFATQALALPRTTAEQYHVGVRVDPDDVLPGDLVFFSTTEPGPSHVGLALDDHTLIHAPSTGNVVRIERFDTPYWQDRLIGVRRVLAGPVASR